MATKMVIKKKVVKRLTPAQAKLAAQALKKKGKTPVMKAKVSAKFTPPGFDAEDLVDHGADEDKEVS